MSFWLPKPAILGVALLWFGTAPAHAAMVDVTVTGLVTDVGIGVTSVFSIGQSMSATFTYDSASLGIPSLILTRMLYPAAVTGGSFAIDAYLGSVAAGRINLADDDPTLNDRFLLTGVGITAASILTHDPVSFTILLEDASQAAFSSLDLPLALPDLVSFTERSWQLLFTPVPLLGFEPTAFVGGRLTTLEIRVHPVPGPGAALLLLVGTGLLALLARAKHMVGRRPNA
jgi:hypothetical protein